MWFFYWMQAAHAFERAMFEAICNGPETRKVLDAAEKRAAELRQRAEQR